MPELSILVHFWPPSMLLWTFLVSWTLKNLAALRARVKEAWLAETEVHRGTASCRCQMVHLQTISKISILAFI
jgi:hypothetical protein